MKRALVALIAGTVLSGLAAAYASTASSIASSDGDIPAKSEPKAKSHKLAASD
jgi:hypothetical protein